MKYLIWLLLCSSLLFSQQSSDVFYSGPMKDNSATVLEKAIYNSSRKHAIYSYNIANATTPGFKPVLLPEDQAALAQFMPEEGDTYFSKVVIEHLMTKMAENKSRHAAFYALYRKKLDNWRQVATLGKK